MDEINDLKKALRNMMFEKRNQIDNNTKIQYDEWICNELEQLIIKRNCKVVHAYIPMLTEIDITPLINKLLALKITVVCPKTLPKRKLENRILHSLNELEIGIMGTKHPTNSTEYTSEFDLIIVPGLAFDSLNYRLGYGGGYYDNFLANHISAYRVGIFYPFQLVNHVPIEPHDICLNEILFKEFSENK